MKKIEIDEDILATYCQGVAAMFAEVRAAQDEDIRPEPRDRRPGRPGFLKFVPIRLKFMTLLFVLGECLRYRPPSVALRNVEQE